MWRLLFLALPLAACTQFPELEGTIDPELKDERFPKLVPISGLLNTPGGTPEDRIAVEEPLLARIAALQARADSLRGDVVDQPTKKRMAKGVLTPDYAKDI